MSQPPPLLFAPSGNPSQLVIAAANMDSFQLQDLVALLDGPATALM